MMIGAGCFSSPFYTGRGRALKSQRDAAETVQTPPTGGRRRELDETLYERIAEMAKRDAADGFFQGMEYRALTKAEKAKVAPDRKAIIAQATSMLARGNLMASALGISIQQRTFKLPSLPYSVLFSNNFTGPYMSINDMQGNRIATYDARYGWSVIDTPKECAKDMELTAVYNNAYRAAKAAQKELSENPPPGDGAAGRTLDVSA